MNVATGSRMRLWRAANDLRLDEVADLTGFSKAHLSRIERGERQAVPLTKVIIARRLGCTVADLFEIAPVEDVSA